MGRILDVRGLRAALHSHELKDEFAAIPLCSATASDVPASSRPKNRYMDILPNPETRVLLSKTSDDASTYINANFVSGANGTPRAFIATQGPLPNTLDDFWRMVWEQDVSAIVMVTNIIENGRLKCHEYWAQTPGEHFRVENFIIDTLDCNRQGDYTVTSLRVTRPATTEVKLVQHFWYTAWPDHGVPNNTSGVLECLHGVRKAMSGRVSPIVIHCSAGIGRSGAFMAAYIAMTEIHNQWRVIDILGTVQRMRTERGGAVQTFIQYLFIHRVLVDYTTLGVQGSLFDGSTPREVTLQKRHASEFLGFSIRGSCPAFVLNVDADGLARLHKIRARDCLLQINGEDVSQLTHVEVVRKIQSSPDHITLLLISTSTF